MPKVLDDIAQKEGQADQNSSNSSQVPDAFNKPFENTNQGNLDPSQPRTQPPEAFQSAFRATNLDPDQNSSYQQQDIPRGNYDQLDEWRNRRKQEKDRTIDKGKQKVYNKLDQRFGIKDAKNKAKTKVKGEIKKRFGKQFAKGTAKQVGKQVAKQAVKQAALRGAQAATASTGVGIPIAIALEIATNKKLRETLIKIVLVIIIGILLLFMFFFKGSPDSTPSEEPATGGSSNSQSPDGTTRNEIIGLTLKLEASEILQNGENIQYTVTVTYDTSSPIPIDTITVFNNIPANTEFVTATGRYDYDSTSKILKWPLSETENRSQFTITLKPLGEDIIVLNRVYATSSFNTGGNNGGGGTPICSQGIGWCSPERLRPYFGDQAEKASTVCNAESSGNPGALNTNCNTNDYSVGLFQINLVAHCPGAYGAGRWGSQSCDNLLSESRRNECKAQLLDPIANIQFAVQNQRAKGWRDWGAARACGVQ